MSDHKRYFVDEEDNDWFGCTLLGPNGFRCELGEPEDRSWLRDGSGAVDELNRLHEENQRLRERVDALQNSLGDFKLYLKTADARNKASRDGSDVYGAVLGVFDKKVPGIECVKSMRHEDRDGGLSYMETPNA